MVDGLLQVEGGRPLTGEITVRGAKNLVPKAMVAALLGSSPSVLRNVPLIRDVDVVSGLLSLHGVSIDYDQREGILQLDPSKVERTPAPRAFRSSSAVRSCTAWERPSSPTWAGAVSVIAPSTSTWRSCVSSAPWWTNRPRASD